MSSDRHIVCTKCASVNRVPAARQALDARCGKCHARLFDGHPADVDAALFDRLLERNTLPVLVDVWAPWCGPCLMMAPAYQAAALELEPGVRLIKLNSDAQQGLSNRLGIRGIPTLILFRDGRTTYVNHPLGGCNNLQQSGRALVTRNFGPQLCRGDLATVVDNTSGMSVGACSLGATSVTPPPTTTSIEPPLERTRSVLPAGTASGPLLGPASLLAAERMIGGLLV